MGVRWRVTGEWGGSGVESDWRVVWGVGWRVTGEWGGSWGGE